MRTSPDAAVPTPAPCPSRTLSPPHRVQTTARQPEAPRRSTETALSQCDEPPATTPPSAPQTPRRPAQWAREPECFFERPPLLLSLPCFSPLFADSFFPDSFFASGDAAGTIAAR